MKITVNNKDYEINPSYGDFEKLYAKYDMNDLEKQSWQEQNQMILDAYWSFLKRRWFGFKPFITLKRFKFKVSMPELVNLSLELPKLLTGEDKQLGNSV